MAYRVEWNAPTDIATGMGAVTTVIGTLVGTYFGHQAGASGKARAEASRERSEAMAKAALAHVDPKEIDDVMEHAQQIFEGNFDGTAT